MQNSALFIKKLAAVSLLYLIIENCILILWIINNSKQLIDKCHISPISSLICENLNDVKPIIVLYAIF